MLFHTALSVLLGMLFWDENVRASNVAQVAHEANVAIGNPKTMINLINGTPYDWVLKNMHEYQMYWWFPEVVPAGTSWEGEVTFRRRGHKDDAAEATFILKNTSSPMSFSLIARPNPENVRVEYHETLSSLNNPMGSKYSLGFENDGGIAFILAGNNKKVPFVSSNPPVAWMQATLDTIGNLRLRDIAVPASHDSGIDILTKRKGGVPYNTVTQSRPIYDQLKAGARVFDIRPVLRKGKFVTAHLHITCHTRGKNPCGKRTTIGGYGRTMQDIIDDINRFNAEYPGELIILNIGHDMTSSNNYQGFRPDEWQQFYDQMSQIRDLFQPSQDLPEHYDPSDLPISSFIQPSSRSTVLIRRGGKPGDSVATSTPSAYIFDHHWWIKGSWSETHNTRALIHDQLQKLAGWTRDNMFQSVWTLTQTGAMVIDVARIDHSILNLAKRARMVLYAHLWPVLRRGRYPNFIEIDDFKDAHVTALCMAINRVFANPDA